MSGNDIKQLVKWIRRIRRFPNLDSSEILAVDNGIEYVKECFPAGTSYFYLPVRGEVFYLNVPVIWNLLQVLASKQKNGLGLRGCYVAAVAKYVKPGVIITMIDNNNWDINLSEYLDIPIICIGNGLRIPSHLDNKHFDCYFALSTATVDKQLSFNCSSREFYPVGHLKMGIYLEQHWNKEPAPANDDSTLLWISQFREFIYFGSREVHLQQKKTELMGIDFMSRFAKEHGHIARVAVASARKKQDLNTEISTFESTGHGNLQFSDEFPDEWVSYHEVRNASLICSMYSTLLFESLSVGKRVVFVLPDDCPELQSDPGQGVRMDLLAPLIFKGSTYESFKHHCNKILDMSDADYERLIKPIQKDVAPLDKNHLPHHQIRDKISAILSDQPTG